jgi:hypothetical protein
MSTSRLSENDIAAAIHAVHRIAHHIHLPAEPDARTVSFLIGVAEIMLRVRVQGSLSVKGAQVASTYAIRAALGSGGAGFVAEDTDGYRDGLLCGAAMAGTLDPRHSRTLVKSARAVSRAHGMPMAEAIAVMSVGASSTDNCLATIASTVEKSKNSPSPNQ